MADMIHEPTAAEAHHNLGLGALTNAIEMDVHRMAPDKRMTGAAWPRESNPQPSGLESDALPLRHRTVID